MSGVKGGGGGCGGGSGEERGWRRGWGRGGDKEKKKHGFMLRTLQGMTYVSQKIP